MISFLPEEIEKYVEEHSAQQDYIAKGLREETYSKTQSPQMMSGHIVGNFLGFLIRITGAKKVLEIGTFTGYSALMMAASLPEDGKLITCDRDRKSTKIAKKFWVKSGYDKKIELKIGPALETISKLKGKFDFVFIDADKENYENYLNAILPMLSEKGLVVVDNVLWSGKVLNPNDAQSQGMDKFNKRVQSDNNLWNIMLSIRDGLMLIKPL